MRITDTLNGQKSLNSNFIAQTQSVSSYDTRSCIIDHEKLVHGSMDVLEKNLMDNG